MMGGATSANAVALTKLFDQLAGSAVTGFDTGATLDGGFSALEIGLYARSDAAQAADNASLRFNNDSGANYDQGYIRNSANSVNAGSTIAGTVASMGYMPAATAGQANAFGSSSVLVPSYDNIIGFKSFVVTYGYTDTDSEQAIAALYQWRSTAAINRVNIFPAVGSHFVAGSRLVIWGRP